MSTCHSRRELNSMSVAILLYKEMHYSENASTEKRGSKYHNFSTSGKFTSLKSKSSSINKVPSLSHNVYYQLRDEGGLQTNKSL